MRYELELKTFGRGKQNEIQKEPMKEALSETKNVKKSERAVYKTENLDRLLSQKKFRAKVKQIFASDSCKRFAQRVGNALPAPHLSALILSLGKCIDLFFAHLNQFQLTAHFSLRRQFLAGFSKNCSYNRGLVRACASEF